MILKEIKIEMVIIISFLLIFSWWYGFTYNWNGTLISQKKTYRTGKLMRNNVKEMYKMCSLLKKYEVNNPLFYTPIDMVFKSDNVYMCKVPKCGSTFWTAAFLAINEFIKPNDFLDLDREVIHLQLQSKVVDKKMKSNPDDIMILTTRDPWRRIYSAYIDKIYRRQSNFLSIIRHLVGKNKTAYCGEVPTFQVFLDYISKHNNNVHWIPVSQLCHVCGNNYNYVIKQENFVEDSKYVLNDLFPNKTQIKEKLISLLTEKFPDASIRQLTRQFTSQQEAKYIREECYSQSDRLKTLWTSLQTQGLISDQASFDLDQFINVTKMSEDEIIDLIVAKSKSVSLSDKERKLQRDRHFRYAFKSVSLETISTIRKVYADDFLLFGYDANPPLD